MSKWVNRHALHGNLKWLNKGKRHVWEFMDFSGDEILQILGVNFPAYYVAIKMDGTILAMNDLLLSALGYSRSEVIGQNYLQTIIPKEDRSFVNEVFQTQSSLKPTVNENRILTKDGQILTCQWFGRPVARDGITTYFFGLGIDITERKRTASALAESEQRFREIVERAPVGIFRRALNGDFILANPGMLRQYECASQEEFRTNYGEERQRWVRPDQLARYRECLLKEGQAVSFETEVRLQTGKTKWFLIYAFMDTDSKEFLSGFTIDLTDQRLAEQERLHVLEDLYQSRKMEAIGKLAGGVAHDFNNVIAGIMGLVEMMNFPNEPLPWQRQADYFRMILASCKRAGDLTKKLLTFSRKGSMTFQPVNLNDLLLDAAEILRRTMDKRITIAVEVLDHPATLEGDTSMLGNAFMNLGINACHAMPEGGNLKFKIREVTLDAFYCSQSRFEIEPGQFLEVEVADTGSGMTPEVQQRIFEPFFTTKAPGSSTGLGLSVVYGTMKEHRGAIHVYSEIGSGTTFRVYLPLAGAHTEAPRVETEPVKGAGTILVVEDEEMLRVVTKAMLEKLGYTVLTACDGAHGVEIVRDNPQKLDLVLLDRIMPVMDGRQALERMHEMAPDLPIVMSSGFTQDEDLEELKRKGLSGFLRKPATLVEISQAVAEAMRG